MGRSFKKVRGEAAPLVFDIGDVPLPFMDLKHVHASLDARMKEGVDNGNTTASPKAREELGASDDH